MTIKQQTSLQISPHQSLPVCNDGEWVKAKAYILSTLTEAEHKSGHLEECIQRFGGLPRGPVCVEVLFGSKKTVEPLHQGGVDYLLHLPLLQLLGGGVLAARRCPEQRLQAAHSCCKLCGLLNTPELEKLLDGAMHVFEQAEHQLTVSVSSQRVISFDDPPEDGVGKSALETEPEGVPISCPAHAEIVACQHRHLQCVVQAVEYLLICSVDLERSVYQMTRVASDGDLHPTEAKSVNDFLHMDVARGRGSAMT